MNPTTAPRKIELFGLPFDNLSAVEMMAEVERFIAERMPRMIFTANASLVVWAQHNAQLRDIFRRCDLLPVDGRAVYYSSYLLRQPIKEMVGAPGLFFRMLDFADARRLRVFFFGAEEGNLQRALQTVRERYPGIVIAGARNGFFSADDEPAIAAQIQASRADMLFLGMSSPRKEQFVDRYRTLMQVPASLGVGGMFDVLAGVYKLAPRWIGVLGLEWFVRLLQEPRRLWKRYASTNSRYLWMLAKALCRTYSEGIFRLKKSP